MNKEQWLKESLPYFDGGFTLVDEDAPDGAWFQMHIDIAENLLNQIEDIGIKRRQDIDAHDIVQHYLNWVGESDD